MEYLVSLQFIQSSTQVKLSIQSCQETKEDPEGGESTRADEMMEIENTEVKAESTVAVAESGATEVVEVDVLEGQNRPRNLLLQLL